MTINPTRSVTGALKLNFLWSRKCFVGLAAGIIVVSCYSYYLSRRTENSLRCLPHHCSDARFHGITVLPCMIKSGPHGSSSPLTASDTPIPSTLPSSLAGDTVFKVMSEAERKQEEERGDARETGVKMDDVDYEIKVEAYDPAVLKHHVLHIQDEHIKGCLSAHPHLYTLG